MLKKDMTTKIKHNDEEKLLTISPIKRDILDDKVLMTRLKDLIVELTMWDKGVITDDEFLEYVGFKQLNNSRAFELISLNGVLVGYLILNIAQKQKTLTINSLILFPEYRHQKIGKTTLRLILAEAKRDGYKYVTIGVEMSNKVAHGLYISLGFIPVTETYNIIKHGAHQPVIPKEFQLVTDRKDLSKEQTKALDDFYRKYHSDISAITTLYDAGFFWYEKEKYNQLTKYDDNGEIVATTGIFDLGDAVTVDFPIGKTEKDIIAILQVAIQYFNRPVLLFVSVKAKYQSVIKQFPCTIAHQQLCKTL